MRCTVVKSRHPSHDRTTPEDRQLYQQQLRDMKAEKDRAERENERSKREWETANKEIRQLTVAQQSASRAERERLEQRVSELEAKKKSSSTKFWKIAGNVLGLGIPALLGMGF